MISDPAYLLRREKAGFVCGLCLLAMGLYAWGAVPGMSVFPAIQPVRPSGVDSTNARSGIRERLLLAAGVGRAVPLEAPINLGLLQPKGRINPDGSEVWGYPEGSDLDGMIEVHVKEGRVVREVLRPSCRIPVEAVSGASSGEDSDQAPR